MEILLDQFIRIYSNVDKFHFMVFLILVLVMESIIILQNCFDFVLIN